jgi:hypothetical protein
MSFSPKSKVHSPKSGKFWTALAERSDDSALPRDQQRRRASLAAAVQMAPAATNVTDIRDIKPPVEIPNGWEWLWWVLATLAVVALVCLIWRWWQRRRSLIPVVPPVPAHIRAKQKLAEALALLAQPKPFCILVSDTVRLYLEERFDFHAPERTTEEFLHELRDTTLLAGEHKEKLGEFLESCDLVKFAKYEPREPELRGLHDSALRLVEETEPREASNPESPAANAAPPPLPAVGNLEEIVNRKS